MKKKLTSLLLILAFCIGWIFFLQTLPGNINKISVPKISFWIWTILFLLLNIGYSVMGLFRQFKKLKKIWISLLSGILLFYSINYLLTWKESFATTSLYQYYLVLPIFIGILALILTKEVKSTIQKISAVLVVLGTIVYGYDKMTFSEGNSMLMILVSVLLFSIYLFTVYSDRNKPFISIYFSIITCFILSAVYLMIHSSFMLPSFNELLGYSLSGIMLFLLVVIISSSYKNSGSYDILIRGYFMIVVLFLYQLLFVSNTYLMKDLIATVTVSIAVLMSLFKKVN